MLSSGIKHFQFRLIKTWFVYISRTFNEKPYTRLSTNSRNDAHRSCPVPFKFCQTSCSRYISILMQRPQWNTEATDDKKTKRVCPRDRAFTSRYDKCYRRDVTIITFHRQFRCVSDEPFLGLVFRRLFSVVRNELANRKNPIKASWLFYFAA